jgi:hypothetical protein
MLSKYIGTSPSTSVVVKLPRLVKELKRSKEKGEKGIASTPKV